MRGNALEEVGDEGLLFGCVGAHVERTRHLLHLSLGRLEARLYGQRFVRVNLDHVRTFRSDARGNLEAELVDGTRSPASRARDQVLRCMGL